MEFREYDKVLYHYLRVMWEAHKLWKYEMFYDFIADDCKLSQMWSKEDIIWKDKILDFYNTKEKAESIWYDIIQLVWNRMNPGVRVNKLHTWDKVVENARISIMYEEWKLGLLLNQCFSWSERIYDVIIFLELNEDNLIKEIKVNLVDFYRYREFLLPYHFDNKSLWDKWYPIYEEDNIFNDQELCNLACMAARETLEKFGYKVTYMQNLQWISPNAFAEKDWKKIMLLIRWFNLKDLADPWFFDTHSWQVVPRELREKNLPDMRLRKFDKRIADEENAEYNIILCYFTSHNPEHKKQWLLYRWDYFEWDISWLETWDFDC